MIKLGSKTHVTGVVGLSKFDSPWIWILLTANTKTPLKLIALIFLVTLRPFTLS